MKYLITILMFLFLLGASTLKNEELNPVIKDPHMPSTTTPIEEINTTPNPTPAENESDVFRGSTIDRQEEEYDGAEDSDSVEEDDSTESP